MNTLAQMILIAGILQFGILIASALVPGVLNWRDELKKLSPLTRHLVWVHGAFIVMTIISLATVSVTISAALASGQLLARSVCAFIAVFWGVRLVLQFALFNPKPYLTTRVLKFGYHVITLVFMNVALTFGYAALHKIF
jgi:hypothetical protein